MTAGKNIPVFLICCLLCTVPLFLSIPAAALDSATVVIHGTIPLVVYDVTVTGIDWYDATVVWKTNGDADSRVEYGTTTGYGASISSGSLVKNHQLSLHSLVPGTAYHFRVISVNPDGLHAASPDSVFATPSLHPGTPVPTITGGGDDGWDWGGTWSNRVLFGQSPAVQETTPAGQEPQQTGAAPATTTIPPATQYGSTAPATPSGVQTSPSGPAQAGPIPGNFYLIMALAVLIIIGILVVSIWHYRNQTPEKPV